MREIRFRAWVKEVHENGEFAYGGYMINPHELKSLLLGGVTSLMTGPRGVGIEYYVTGSYPLPMFGSLEFMRSDEIEIMQYTGLKDRNGKEIYEGDILQSTLTHQQVGKVIFEDGIYSALWIKNNPFGDDSPYSSVLYRVRHNVEIIGNIYEHPHLLEEVKPE